MKSLELHLVMKRDKILDRLRLVHATTATRAIRAELDRLDEYLHIIRK